MEHPSNYIRAIFSTSDLSKRLEIVNNQVSRRILADIVLQMASAIDELHRQIDEIRSRNKFAQWLAGVDENAIEAAYHQIHTLELELERHKQGVQALQQMAPEGPPPLEVSPALQEDDPLTINAFDERGGFSSVPADQHCFVTFSVRIQHGKRWEKINIIKDTEGRPLYPGTIETLSKEIEHRIVPLLRRAPTIDDLPDWVRLQMIPKDVLVMAMMELSIFRYIPALQHEVQRSVLDAFEIHIKPYFSEEYDVTESEAKELFRNFVEETFEAMEKRRNIPKPHLATKRGRPPKRSQEIEQHYERMTELSKQLRQSEKPKEIIKQLEQELEALKTKHT